METIGCFICSSRNGSNPHCEDPYHPGYSSTSYTEKCKVPKRNHVGEFPAHFCVKVIGTSCKSEKKTMENIIGSYIYEITMSCYKLIYRYGKRKNCHPEVHNLHYGKPMWELPAGGCFVSWLHPDMWPWWVQFLSEFSFLHDDYSFGINGISPPLATSLTTSSRKGTHYNYNTIKLYGCCLICLCLMINIRIIIYIWQLSFTINIIIVSITLIDYHSLE